MLISNMSLVRAIKLATSADWVAFHDTNPFLIIRGKVNGRLFRAAYNHDFDRWTKIVVVDPTHMNILPEEEERLRATLKGICAGWVTGYAHGLCVKPS